MDDKKTLIERIESNFDLGSDTDDWQEYVTWLLADIRLYCDFKNCNFHHAVDESYQMYLHDTRR